MATTNASALYGYTQAWAAIAQYSYAIAAVAVLFDYLVTMVILPAGIATRRSMPRRNTTKSAVNGSPHANSVLNSAASPIFASQCLRSPNGHTAELTSASVTESKPLKPKPEDGGLRRR